MEAQMFITLVIASLLLWLAFKLIHLLWLKPKSLEKKLHQLGIKGTSYKFFFGDMIDFGRSFKAASSKPMNLSHDIAPRVLPFNYKSFQKYGKVSMFWYGTRPNLIIADPELVKEALSYKLGHIEKPPQDPHVSSLSIGLVTMEGEKWIKQRKLVNPAFHIDKIKGMTPAFLSSCVDLIERWKKSASPQGFCDIDVWTDIQNFTADVISKTAFGSNFEEGKKIFELQKEQTVLVMEATQSLYIPGWRFLPTEKNIRRKKLKNEIKSNLQNIVQRKTAAMKTGESGADDLLGMLLQNSNQNATHVGMTIDEVIEECKLFYFAGQETSANLLTWTMILLAMRPSWQEKARVEVLEICGKNLPSFENLNHFKIVNMILNESLRLYPPAAQQVRYTAKETKLGDILLPAGVQLMLSTLLIHHDSDVWGEDVQEFKPERFADGISKASKDQVAFFPFGWGPRVCVAQNFAMVEAKMALSMILQNFEFELSPSYTHAPHTVLTLQPQHGAQLVLRVI
ncbi:hypothetical protein ACHQM5_020048 [Ranunculus cassubicifolius]